MLLRKDRRVLHLQQRQRVHDLRRLGVHLEQNLVVAPPVTAEVTLLFGMRLFGLRKVALHCFELFGQLLVMVPGNLGL